MVWGILMDTAPAYVCPGSLIVLISLSLSDPGFCLPAYIGKAHLAWVGVTDVLHRSTLSSVGLFTLIATAGCACCNERVEHFQPACTSGPFSVYPDTGLSLVWASGTRTD